MARFRPHARTCPDSRIRRRCRAGRHRPARHACRYRGNDRAKARTGRRRAWPERGAMSFALDPRLAADTIEIGDLALSRLLLMDDARYLWLVLVPRHENLSELIHLGETNRAILMEEITAVSKALIGFAGVDKINVGALGNIVRQLHVHVVARY